MVLDFNVLGSIVGDKAGQIEILKSLQDENHHDIDSIRLSIEQGNMESIAKAAHRMKGVCRMVGANELHEFCYQIEMAAKQGDLQSVLMTFRLLGDAMNRLEAITDRLVNNKPI